MNKIKTLAQKIVAPAVLALTGLGALAQTAPVVSPNTQITTVTTAKDKLLFVINTAIGIVGIVAVVLIVYGAYMYVTAGVSEDNAKKAKSILLYGILGIVVAALSYAIVQVTISFIGTAQTGIGL